MNVELLINKIMIRPGAYVGDETLESIAQFINGFLFNNLITGRADSVDLAFKEDFNSWVLNWLKANRNVTFISTQRNYIYYLRQVCNNSKVALYLFFDLCVLYFNELHRQGQNSDQTQGDG